MQSDAKLARSGAAGLAIFLFACGSSGSSAIDAGGWPQSGDGGPVEVRDGGVVIEDDDTTWVCYVTSCASKILDCGDCIDNDGDGKTDSHDRECLGPCDNTETPALSAGVGGETGGPCRADCYFDFGNGAGNDDCHWDHRCDPLAIAPDYPPEGPDCAYEEDRVSTSDCPDAQSATCLSFCPQITPNGCDCFGCCTFPQIDGSYVWIGAMDEDKQGTCTFDAITDSSLCPPCTPVADCLNDCGPCELCLGRDTLPPECDESERCSEGVQPCGLPTDEACPPGDYCVTGCCIPGVD